MDNVGIQAFFKSVYLYAFDFAKAPGQRSIPVDNAKAFWGILLPLVRTHSVLLRSPSPFFFCFVSSLFRLAWPRASAASAALPLRVGVNLPPFALRTTRHHWLPSMPTMTRRWMVRYEPVVN